MQKFYKGRTNNHLTWVMVDATDFATPESALSAATKIKVYGKLRSATGTNLVSSGTGSLTNDITHVGASALGIYTIALAKADLSDASAAWYDQYIVSLSATGAAYQTLIVDGGIDDSFVSNMLSSLSAVISDIRSNVSDLQSDFQSRVPKAVATNSQLSDLHSDLRSVLVVISGVQSDVYSALVALSDAVSNVDSALNSQYSDIASKIGGISVSLDDSAISDIASAVVAALPVTSDLSDIYSLLSSLNSEFLSRVPKETAARSQLSDLHSDLRSVLVVMSGVLSDTYSALSDFQSDFASRVPKRVATDSQLSDLASDLRSHLVLLESSVSDVDSALTSHIALHASSFSDLASQIAAGVTIATGGIGAAAFAAGAIDNAAIAADAIGAAELAQAAAQEIADEVLNRNLAGGGSGNTRNVRNALRSLRNRQIIASDILTVYQEDDATPAWSAAVSRVAGDPLQEVDPS